MNAATVIASVAASVLLAGCAISNPAAPPAPGPPHVAPAPSGLRTSGPVVRAQHDELVRVAVDYTLTQATWSADSYVSQRARLAALATGRALNQLAPRDGQPPAVVAAQLAAARSGSRAVLLGTDRSNRGQEVVVAYKVNATGSGRSTRPDYAIAHLTLTRQHRVWRVATFAIQP